MKLCAVVIFLFGAFALGNARPTFGPYGLGSCPVIPSLDSFDMSKFTGKWYEMMKFPFFMEFGTKCVEFNVTNAYGGIRIDTKQLTTYMNLPLWAYGSLKVPDNRKPAEMEWRFYSWFYFPTPFNVIETDYENYALIYSCVDAVYRGFGIHQDNAWILTRSRETVLRSSVLNGMMEKLKSHHVNTDNFMQTDNVSCG